MTQYSKYMESHKINRHAKKQEIKALMRKIIRNKITQITESVDRWMF